MRSPSLAGLWAEAASLAGASSATKSALCGAGGAAGALPLLRALLPCSLPPWGRDGVKLFPSAPRSVPAGLAQPGLAQPGVFGTHLSATSCGIAERFANISVSFTGRVFFRLLKQAGKSSGRASAPVHSFPSPAVTALLLGITRQSGTGHSLVLPLPNFGKLTLPQERREGAVWGSRGRFVDQSRGKENERAGAV